MPTFTRPLTTLTAEDIMSRNVLVIPHRMSLRTAATMLSKAQVSGAPVVDETGRCIGVLSSIDFLHAAQCERHAIKPSDSCVCTAWQIVELEQMPTEDVSMFMSKDPITASPSASLTELAKTMTESHIHRIVVVDSKARPLGIVSSTDIVAAVAREE